MSTIRRKVGGKRIYLNVFVAPLDNIYFHSKTSVHKWKYVYQRRIAYERELTKHFLEWSEIINILKDVGLMKTILDVGPCYENLVKQFILNLLPSYSIEGSQKYMKVYVRGNV